MSLQKEIRASCQQASQARSMAEKLLSLVDSEVKPPPKE